LLCKSFLSPASRMWRVSVARICRPASSSSSSSSSSSAAARLGSRFPRMLFSKQFNAVSALCGVPRAAFHASAKLPDVNKSNAVLKAAKESTEEFLKVDKETRESLSQRVPSVENGQQVSDQKPDSAQESTDTKTSEPGLVDYLAEEAIGVVAQVAVAVGEKLLP